MAALRIGSIVVPNRVFLAPMSGTTDASFRSLVSKLGAGLVISEMTASSRLASGDRDARSRAAKWHTGLHVVQLAGCEARWMAEGARLAEAAGADIIDINMGCPARRVTNGDSGSALMRDPDHAIALIEATVEAVGVPVTLKMRLGWDGASINAAELARRAEQAGVQLVTVHGRTRCQFYQGRADWSAIRTVKKSIGIPVVVNGDITSISDAEEALRRSEADALMIGRAAVGRPWLLGQVAQYLCTGVAPAVPPLAAQKAWLITLHEEMLKHHGAEIGLRHARKHVRAALDVAAVSAGLPPDAMQSHRSAILTADEPASVMRRIEDAYDAAAQRAAA